jgi:carboxypeptidase family protein
MVQLLAVVLAALLQIVPAMPGPQAPPRDTSQKTGTARIRGHVFAADTGQPLRKAQVRAISPELRENRMATTDADGAYEIKELPAGRYTLTSSKGSFVQLAYGQLRPFEAGKPLEVGDGQTIEKVDFSLPRGSVVVGRVLDEFGEPATDVQVSAMRYQFIQGRRRLTPAGRTSMTNDIGEFRIFALPPGQYFLSATLRGAMPVMDAVSDDRSGYAPTYFPGTANIAEAQRITVRLGQALSDINIPLVPSRTARISGTSVDSAGKPLVGGFVIAIQRNGMMMTPTNVSQVRADGTFTISNLTPGEYMLESGMPALGGEMGTANVTISGDDVNGVQLVAAKPSTGTGRIIVDPAAAKSLQPATLRIVSMPANPDLLPIPGSGRVNDDLTFEIKAPPGLQFVRLNAAVPTAGWVTKAIRYKGTDVTDTGVEFRPNEDLDGLEIELTNTPTEVSGLVTGAKGDASKDYTVVVFAQDRERWGYMSRYVSTGRPDQDGRFKIRNLPAGQYQAVALDFVEPGEATDPEFLDRVQSKATAFSLKDGEAKTLDLKLNSSS